MHFSINFVCVLLIENSQKKEDRWAACARIHTHTWTHTHIHVRHLMVLYCVPNPNHRTKKTHAHAHTTIPEDREKENRKKEWIEWKKSSICECSTRVNSTNRRSFQHTRALVLFAQTLHSTVLPLSSSFAQMLWWWRERTIQSEKTFKYTRMHARNREYIVFIVCCVYCECGVCTHTQIGSKSKANLANANRNRRRNEKWTKKNFTMIF